MHKSWILPDSAVDRLSYFAYIYIKHHRRHHHRRRHHHHHLRVADDFAGRWMFPLGMHEILPSCPGVASSSDDSDMPRQEPSTLNLQP